MCHTRRLLPPLDWFHFLRKPTGEGALGSGGGGGGGGGGAQRARVRATEGVGVGKTARRERRRRRRRQHARGARDGGAEQRPLARSLLRLVPETRALPERASGKGGQAWRRGTRVGGGEQPSAPCAVRRPGEGAAGDGSREQPTPGRRFERGRRNACAGAAGRSVVGRGGAGRGPGARRRPRRRLGAPHGRGAPLMSGPELRSNVCCGGRWVVGGGVI